MNLRKELRPPEFDKNELAKLADLAERLDGCHSEFEDCAALRAEFNLLAGSNLQAGDFHFSGGTDAETFVRGVLTPKPEKMTDVSYDEMLELLTRICNADGSEYELNYWLKFLAVQLENNKLSDLIYHPDHYFGDGVKRAEMTPKEMLDEALANKPKIFYL